MIHENQDAVIGSSAGDALGAMEPFRHSRNLNALVGRKVHLQNQHLAFDTRNHEQTAAGGVQRRPHHIQFAIWNLLQNLLNVECI